MSEPLFSEEELSPWLREDDDDDRRPGVWYYAADGNVTSKGNAVLKVERDGDTTIMTPLATDEYDEASDPGDERGLHALHGRDDLIKGFAPRATTGLDLSREVGATNAEGGVDDGTTD